MEQAPDWAKILVSKVTELEKRVKHDEQHAYQSQPTLISKERLTVLLQDTTLPKAIQPMIKVLRMAFAKA